ncbi:hypothetical protein QBC38DRAFT_454094 [Podospora fimiseda]|uniref:Uncharacterized protein n=1 Tax=Podospora fimiseda TaxID=252190 RepID=A0AAN7BSI2_9PEZI|nr:hypothetical protein QBC38DRAFT_454094 [Podospora fimiseda]
MNTDESSDDIVPSAEIVHHTTAVHRDRTSFSENSRKRRRSLVMTWPYERFPKISNLLATNFKEPSGKLPSTHSSSGSSSDGMIPEFGDAGVSHLTTVTTANILSSRTRSTSRASTVPRSTRASPTRQQPKPKPKPKSKNNQLNDKIEDTIVVEFGQDLTESHTSDADSPLSDVEAPEVSSDDELEDIPAGPVSDLRRSKPSPLPTDAEQRVIATVIGSEEGSDDGSQHLPEGASPDREVYRLSIPTVVLPRTQARVNGRFAKKLPQRNMLQDTPNRVTVNFMDPAPSIPDARVKDEDVDNTLFSVASTSFPPRPALPLPVTQLFTPVNGNETTNLPGLPSNGLPKNGLRFTDNNHVLRNDIPFSPVTSTENSRHIPQDAPASEPSRIIPGIIPPPQNLTAPNRPLHRIFNLTPHLANLNAYLNRAGSYQPFIRTPRNPNSEE